MKLYTVEIKTEIVVLADSIEEAEMRAESVAQESRDFDVLARDLVILPAGWSLRDLPYVAEPPHGDEQGDFVDDVESKPIGLLIEEGAAPRWRGRL